MHFNKPRIEQETANEMIIRLNKQEENKSKERLFEQIATYFEKWENWRRMKDLWLENGKSYEFRQMLRYAMELEKEPQNSKDWITSKMTESMEC